MFHQNKGFLYLYRNVGIPLPVEIWVVVFFIIGTQSAV